MGPIWTIARREVKALFDQPTAYILLVVFTGLNGFLFFREADVYGAASLRPMLDLLPWLLLFLVPAVTMRALAEDTRSGTLEVVLAQPITELELILGKYLGQVLVLLIGLAITLTIPLGLALGTAPELGVVVAQYVGAVLLVAGLAAVGVWASSISRNQVSAFIVAVFVMFVLILVGLDPLLVGLPPRLGSIAASLGVLSHFTQIARGVIDLRDAVYFVTLAALFLVLAYLALVSRKLTAHGESLKRLRLARRRGPAGHPAGAVQRGRPGGVAAQGRLSRPRGALRRRGQDDPLHPTNQRPRVPGHLGHPRAHPPRAPGDRVRRAQRRGVSAQPAQLPGAEGPARPQLHRAPVPTRRHDDRARAQGDRGRRHARFPAERCVPAAAGVPRPRRQHAPTGGRDGAVHARADRRGARRRLERAAQTLRGRDRVGHGVRPRVERLGGDPVAVRAGAHALSALAAGHQHARLARERRPHRRAVALGEPDRHPEGRRDGGDAALCHEPQA